MKHHHNPRGLSMLFVLLFLLASCVGKENNDVQTILVKRGTFTEELIEEGTVRAVNSISVTAPRISYRYGSLKIASMVKDGTEVEKGDTLIIFDPAEVKKAIVDIEQKLEIAGAEFDKMLATQKSEIEDLESDLELSRISLEISKINFEQSVHEAEITKKEIKLKLDNARVALDRAGEQIESKKKIHKVDVFQKQIEIDQLKEQLEEARRTIDKLFVVSPARGIAILEQNWMSNQKWQVGDQPFAGSKVIELPDLDEMMADVQINEVDALKVSTGVKVLITPDAYSDTTFEGEITWMANLAQNKDYNSRVKVFPVGVYIPAKSNKLMPGLTVRCKLMLKEIPGVLMIPLESVFKDDLDEYVYIKTASGFKRHNVKISAYNSDYALIAEGLAENDELALTNPFRDKMEETDNNADKPTL
ncbi:MAG TPA: HlyD family efflux transporter periplasmic adaptor subunit [Bacteroidales bacterium]|nr:HlyD family efflux transporter periplasmic adaptor subunit [Bacteroidales bacterium]